MTSSITSYLSENTSPRIVKEAFLYGLVSVNELQQLNRGRFSYVREDSNATRRFEPADLGQSPPIPVTQAAALLMLDRLQCDEISREELADWAVIVVGFPEFAPIGTNDAERDAEAESGLWSVLRELADPTAQDLISKDRVPAYIQRVLGPT